MTIKPIEKIMTLTVTAKIEIKETIQAKNEDAIYDAAEAKRSDVEAIFSNKPHKLAFEDIDFKSISNVEVKHYE
ncbi:hypothetical protein ACWEWU_14820 [Staphylococcus xylosus]|uniref:hypothetical protein n=1 Tax=Staphylococcus xylosus TaxID=1288 RepID=UPI000E694AD1|nr:hypothetical protein [Staphylococcus xylosus]